MPGRSDIGSIGETAREAILTKSAFTNFLAAAVVIHNSAVLTVRRSSTERFLPGVWGVPCGKLDPGESPEAAVARELEEETNLTGRVIAQVGRSTFLSQWNGRVVHNRQTNFLIFPTTLAVKLPKSDQEHRWVPIEDIDKAELDAHNRDTVQQALVFITSPGTDPQVRNLCMTARS
ncbi:NUDIX hydrolase [Streptomyces sp. NBC_00370]|uniref:NUDIX hydrolase n=1 Tax=Streptomyces sp. NBC_00370 TaxID=2975728 RepID=UPI002E270325